MKIFDKRPLSLILCITLGAFVFFSYYDYSLLRTFATIILLTVLALTFIKPIASRIPHLQARIASICAIFAFAFSFIYFDLWFKAYDRYSGDVCIEGQIESISDSTYKSTVILKTDNINDTSFSKYRLVVHVEKDKYYGYSIGSKVKLTGTIEAHTSDKNFDAQSYYTSRGISGVINEVKSFSVTDVGEYPLSYKIEDMRKSICRRIIYTSNEDVGGLLCGLLLGEKDYLPLGTELDFSRIGISHILALSGMHLAILAIGFTKLLACLRVNKKLATALMIPFTLFYMALTGFSVSVMRAGIMLVVSSMLFLLSRTRDSMTSLFVAVTLICVIEPNAIFDTSLWLSAFATLGIVVIGEYQGEKYSKPSIIKWMLTSFLASLFAISATFAISVLKFDGISILAPLSTLVFSVLVELFIHLGLVLLLLGSFMPIKYLLIPLGNIIIILADRASDIGFIYSSTNFLIIKFLAIGYTVLFFSFFIFKIKRKRLAIASFTVLLTCIFSLSVILTHIKERDTSLTYCNGLSERFIMTENGEICVIDITSYNRNSAYSMYGEITDKCLTRIDKYMITNYSYDLEESLITLAESILVKELYIPTPQNKTEERIFFDISQTAEALRIKVNMYQNEDIISVGESAIVPIHNFALNGTKKNLFTIFRKDKVYTYLGPDILDGETKNMALDIIAGSHTIIIGRHRNKDSVYEFLYKLDAAENIVFSYYKITSDEDIYKFYFDKGANIFSSPSEYDLYVE